MRHLEGEIAVIYFGDNDRSSLVKMKVKIDKDYTGVTEGDNFTLEITEVGDTRVRAAITPKDPEMSYYVYPRIGPAPDARRRAGQRSPERNTHPRPTEARRRTAKPLSFFS